MYFLTSNPGKVSGLLLLILLLLLLLLVLQSSLLDDRCVVRLLLLLHLHAELLLRVLLVIRKVTSLGRRSCHHWAHQLVVWNYRRLGCVLGVWSVTWLLHALRVVAELVASSVLVRHGRSVALVKGLRVNVTVATRRCLLLRLSLLLIILIVVVSWSQGPRAIPLYDVWVGLGTGACCVLLG